MFVYACMYVYICVCNHFIIGVTPSTLKQIIKICDKFHDFKWNSVLMTKLPLFYPQRDSFGVVSGLKNNFIF